MMKGTKFTSKNRKLPFKSKAHICKRLTKKNSTLTFDLIKNYKWIFFVFDPRSSGRCFCQNLLKKKCDFCKISRTKITRWKEGFLDFSFFWPPRFPWYSSLSWISPPPCLVLQRDDSVCALNITPNGVPYTGINQ